MLVSDGFSVVVSNEFSVVVSSMPVVGSEIAGVGASVS